METAHIARVEGGSGTFVVPAHSPYDRQILREHVRRLAGRVPTLTLGLHGRQWIVTRHGVADVRCTACMQPVGYLSCSRGGDARATCIDCALRPRADEITQGEPQ